MFVEAGVVGKVCDALELVDFLNVFF